MDRQNATKTTMFAYFTTVRYTSATGPWLFGVAVRGFVAGCRPSPWIQDGDGFKGPWMVKPSTESNVWSRAQRMVECKDSLRQYIQFYENHVNRFEVLLYYTWSFFHINFVWRYTKTFDFSNWVWFVLSYYKNRWSVSCDGRYDLFSDQTDTEENCQPAGGPYV